MNRRNPHGFLGDALVERTRATYRSRAGTSRSSPARYVELNSPREARLALTPPHLTALVDDDEAIREAVVDLLESVGLRCISFESAEQYLADPRRADVGCLILDVNLPGMSGLELHRRIVEAHDGTPVLFLTSVDDPPVRERAMQLGARIFFSKPVDSAHLLSGIQDCLMGGC